jgi:dTDP-4-dehydrorhamnose 3,5-epimerase
LNFTPQLIPDVILIEPELLGDNRGYFFETFRQDLLNKAIGSHINFIQDNESKSSKDVLRGLHYQIPPFSQSKLVRVIDGRVLDIAVDIRLSSPTFGKYISVELSSANKRQLFMPHGFAHGFVVLSDSATLAYKVDSYYSPEHERGIAFDDKDLKINWQLNLENIRLSDKDRNNPTLANSNYLFD